MTDLLPYALTLVLGFQNGWWAANRFRLWSERLRVLPARRDEESGK